jgi:hypothetical protein
MRQKILSETWRALSSCPMRGSFTNLSDLNLEGEENQKGVTDLMPGLAPTRKHPSPSITRPGKVTMRSAI